MQYREYGKTGVKVSVLGFGALRLPKKPKLAVEILRRAFDLGVNYVDTAAKYPISNQGANERVVEEALRGYQDSDLYCTGCGYCLPCPSKVYIPGNFEAMNYYRVWGLEELARKRYRQLGKNKSRRWAAACVECVECESKCPQNIPIRARLKEVTATLGG